jgi:hypothetical protein
LTEITRSATSNDLRPLLEAARDATIAWVADGRLASAPVAFRFNEGQYRFGTPAGTLSDDVVVSLSVDDGAMYFDLRGVRVRGPVRRIDAPEGTVPSLDWFEVGVERETAWHYGTLREHERRRE